MTVDQFFAPYPRARRLYDVLERAVHAVGDVQVKVTKSQVAFRRRKTFAWAWVPERALKREGLAPLVLSVGLSHRDGSPRWKEVAAPAPGHFTHHVELYRTADIDDEVRGWLKAAYDEAT